MASSESLFLCPSHRESIARFLPFDHDIRMEKTHDNSNSNSFPQLTLTYAVSLDSMISLAPETQTVLSGIESKALTHYLRAHHDAILVGATTAITDDPRLTSRWEGINNTENPLKRQPRPIVLDPSGRWLSSIQGQENLLQLTYKQRGQAPWVITDSNLTPNPNKLKILHSFGGEHLAILPDYKGKQFGVDWSIILSHLLHRGIQSIMVEGGATVIHDLMRKKNQQYLSSLIVTIAPVYLGIGGITISPNREDNPNIESFRLNLVKWIPMGTDVVMAART